MVNVWLVGAEANLVEVLPESERGVFWSANAYMVLYSYTVRAAERSVLYFWKGADVTPLNFLTWRFQLARLLQKMPGAPVPRVCNQGEEPERFMAIMEGTIVLTGTHPLARTRPVTIPTEGAGDGARESAGEVASGEAPNEGGGEEGADGESVAAGATEAETLPMLDGVVLLHVKRYSPTPLGVCARQVPARMHYLDSRDAFLLLHTGTGCLYLWVGRLAASNLVSATRALAQRMLDAQPRLRFVVASEGEEPPPFWEVFTAPHAEDAAARNASAFDASAGASASAAPVRLDAEAKAKQLAAEVAQARGWRNASSGRRTLVWRARALGYAASRVQYERGRAGVPLRASLHAKAVLIVDAVVCLFVWVGEDASEDDETLAMQLAQLYAQSAERAVQVSHVLAGAEPDEFRRLFHGWLPWIASPDPHARRRDKLTRRLGLAGRVMRDVAWPGNPATDLRIAAEAAEEVLAGGLVVFSTTCGVVPSTRIRCTRARHLLRQRGASYLDVDLGVEPAELPTLRLLLSSNGVKDQTSAQHLPIIFLNGTLLAGGRAAPSLQELEDDSALQAALHKELAPRAVAVSRELPAMRELEDSLTLHQGWLLKEGGVLRTTWQRRWCVLQPAGIYYFRERNRDERAAGLIPINGASVRLLSSDFHFEVSTARRAYLFRVDREPPPEDVRPATRPRELSWSRLSLSGVPNPLTYLGSSGGLFGNSGGGASATSGEASGSVQRERSNSSSADGVGAVAGGGSMGEVDSQRFGKELARWMAALQRAHAMRPEEEGRHHIKRVHLLTSRCSDGLLRQVGQKQREHRELHGTPERTSFLRRSIDDDEQRRLAAAARMKLFGEAKAATSWLALPTAHGGWLWRWDDGEARWVRLWCVLQGRALLCYAETYASVDASAAAAAVSPSIASPQSPGASFRAGGAVEAASGASPAASGGSASVPEGIDLERPLIVLWPRDGTLARSSDTVHAPSAYVFMLTAASGRRHRLCASTAGQLHGWMALLSAEGPAGVQLDGAGGRTITSGQEGGGSSPPLASDDTVSGTGAEEPPPSSGGLAAFAGGGLRLRGERIPEEEEEAWEASGREESEDEEEFFDARPPSRGAGRSDDRDASPERVRINVQMY